MALMIRLMDITEKAVRAVRMRIFRRFLDKLLARNHTHAGAVGMDKVVDDSLRGLPRRQTHALKAPSARGCRLAAVDQLTPSCGN